MSHYADGTLVQGGPPDLDPPENPRDRVGTPNWVFRAAIDLFGAFDLDACADFERHVVPRYYARGVLGGGLARDWNCERAWCNPPYSDVPTWIDRAVQEVEARHAREVVMLVMADTSTRYFHNAVNQCARALLVTPRISFNGHKGSPVFGSAFLVVNACTLYLGSARTIECLDLRSWRERYGSRPRRRAA